MQGKPGWERIRDPPNFWVTDGAFYMSFKFRCLEEAESVVYFAFTYPYTYKELQQCRPRRCPDTLRELGMTLHPYGQTADGGSVLAEPVPFLLLVTSRGSML